MAVIYKISGYLIDPNGHEHVSMGTDIENAITEGLGMFGQHIHIENEGIEEWQDNIPLNYPNCDLAECEKWFPKGPTKGRNIREVKAGSVYRHFKGHRVKVLAISEDTENVGSYVVVYECLGDGCIWHRPYDMFISEVDRAKYPKVTQQYRFEELEDDEKTIY